MQKLRHFAMFFVASVREVTSGSRVYFGWLLFLLVVFAIGLAAYSMQLQNGLSVTSLNDDVSWGAYIANFTFCEGLAAAAAMVVIPAYVYKDKEVMKVVFIGEFLAIAAVVMCLLFVAVDVGRPAQSWHMIPMIGLLNFPHSVMAWDVVVLQGYLIINLYLVTYALFAKFRHRRPKPERYLPIVFISMIWAVSMLTATAFLYSWLGARPFWNSAIVAPRFITASFVVGPAFLIVAFDILKDRIDLEVAESVTRLMRNVLAITLAVNLFLFFSEIFAELYSTKPHRVSLVYLLFGLHGHNMLVPFIWTAIGFNCFALVVVAVPRFANRRRLLHLACVMAFVGVWIEKAMGLVVPGFVPTPLGEITEYWPSAVETLVSAGIWAAGLLVFTILVKIGVPIEKGELSLPLAPEPDTGAAPIPEEAP